MPFRKSSILRRSAAIAIGASMLVSVVAIDGSSFAASTSTSSGVKAAVAAVLAAEKPIAFSAPSPSYSIKPLAGKSIWYIAPTMSVPFIAAIAAGFKAAGQAAGLKVTIFDGQGNVNTWNQGMSEAVSQGASGIVLQGISPSVVSGPLAQAVAKKIPVIDSLTGNPTDPLPKGILAHVTVNYKVGGQLLADWVIADSKGHAHVVIFTSSVYTIYVRMLAGFKAEFAKRCPTTCKIDAIEDVAPNNWATQIGTIASTQLSRHPDVNYFVPVADAMVTFIAPSLSQVKSSVKIISHDGVTTNVDLIRSGKTQQADVSNPPNASIGWAQVDELGRLMLGNHPVTENLPQQILVKSNVGKNDKNLFPQYSNYASAFKANWGL